MPKKYRVQLYWQGRQASVSQMADELWEFTASLGELEPRLARLRPFTREDELLQPLTGPQHAEAVLTHWEVRWRTGAVERASYKPGLVLDRLEDPPVRVELVTGIEALAGLEGVWVPNRLEVLVRDDAGDDLVRPDVLLGVLRAGVRVFEPDWGFVAVDGDPVPPAPLFSKGRPEAAWVVYLSREYPADRVAVRDPSAVYAVGDLGSIVLAHPELPAPGTGSQREAVAKVEEALRAAGIAA